MAPPAPVLPMATVRAGRDSGRRRPCFGHPHDLLLSPPTITLLIQAWPASRVVPLPSPGCARSCPGCACPARPLRPRHIGMANQRRLVEYNGSLKYKQRFRPLLRSRSAQPEQGRAEPERRSGRSAACSSGCCCTPPAAAGWPCLCDVGGVKVSLGTLGAMARHSKAKAIAITRRALVKCEAGGKELGADGDMCMFGWGHTVRHLTPSPNAHHSRSLEQRGAWGGLASSFWTPIPRWGADGGACACIDQSSVVDVWLGSGLVFVFIHLPIHPLRVDGCLCIGCASIVHRSFHPHPVSVSWLR